MNGIRLKGNLTEPNLLDRLKYKPEILEFYLSDSDMEQPERIRQTIRRVKDTGCRVYLHHPPKHRNRFLDIRSSDPVMDRFYQESSKLLAEICHQEQIHCVIHAHYSGTESSSHITLENTLQLREAIRAIVSYAGDRFLWEDSIEGLFSYSNPYLIGELIAPLTLPLTVDVSHTFISFRGDNRKLKEVLEATAPYARYYHLVDSMGVGHDSLPIGKGDIDWAMVKPLVEGRDYIFEIGLPGDHSDCSLMVESALYFRDGIQGIRV